MHKSYSIIPRILQTIAWLPTRLLLVGFCGFEVRGTQHLDGIDQAIFAVNHANELDPIILTAAINPLGRFAPMFYVAGPLDGFHDKKFGWRRRLYSSSWFFRAWGAYPHVPGHKNYERSLAQHRTILKNGGSLCIFPEGGTTKDGKLREGKGGVAYLSHATHVPVIPVAIVGTYRLSFKRFLDRRYHITLVFGKPKYVHEIIAHSAPEPARFKDVAREIMAEIETSIESALREARHALQRVERSL